MEGRGCDHDEQYWHGKLDFNNEPCLVFRLRDTLRHILCPPGRPDIDRPLPKVQKRPSLHRTRADEGGQWPTSDAVLESDLSAFSH
jgi:hypothetical protein